MLSAVLMFSATTLLLIVDWFAFHDFREPHSTRDWLMLLASALVFIRLGSELYARHLGHR